MQCRSSPSSHEGPPSRCLDPTISVSPWRRVVVVKTLRIHTALTFAQTPARGVAPALQAPSGGLGDYPPPVRSSEVWHSRPCAGTQPPPPPRHTGAHTTITTPARRGSRTDTDVRIGGVWDRGGGGAQRCMGPQHRRARRGAVAAASTSHHVCVWRGVIRSVEQCTTFPGGLSRVVLKGGWGWRWEIIFFGGGSRGG